MLKQPQRALWMSGYLASVEPRLIGVEVLGQRASLGRGAMQAVSTVKLMIFRFVEIYLSFNKMICKPIDDGTDAFIPSSI